MKIVQHVIVVCIASLLVMSVLVSSHEVKGSQSPEADEYFKATTTPQFVLLSFDGSKSIDMWRETREFARQMNEKGKPLHFTYFINAVYFLDEKNKDVYISPAGNKGESMIGFADGEDDIIARVHEINEAFKEGHEIGSHTAGHFMGSFWSEKEWKQEFDSFEQLLFNAQLNNNNQKIPSLVFGPRDIVGFRAPELQTNNSLYRTLADSHFVYDASGVGLPDAMPKKDRYGIWHIPLNTIEIGDERASAIAMDYSLWMHQSGGENIAKKHDALWDGYFNEVRGAYLEYFNRNYNGKRAPVVIGHHFSLWNDGVYWEAMKSFAEEVCGKPEVKCITFKEYARYLDFKNPLPLVKKE